MEIDNLENYIRVGSNATLGLWLQTMLQAGVAITGAQEYVD